MFRRIIISSLLLTFVISIQGCTLAKISGRGTSPLILNQPQAKVEVVEKITASKQILFDYTGAIDISEVLAKITMPANIDAIINVNITIKSTVGDFFVNLFTLGIANARTVEVTGDAVRAPNGLSYLNLPEADIYSESASLEGLMVPIANSDTDPATMVIKTVNGYSVIRYNPSSIAILNSH